MTRESAWTIARERDGGQCWGCGQIHGSSKQHRQNRQMGGDPTGSKERPSNLIPLSLDTNVRVEHELQELGILLGWKVPNRSALPTSLYPVWSVPYQWWAVLDDVGNADLISHDRAYARIEEATGIEDVAGRIRELGALEWRCGMPAPRAGR